MLLDVNIHSVHTVFITVFIATAAAAAAAASWLTLHYSHQGNRDGEGTAGRTDINRMYDGARAFMAVRRENNGGWTNAVHELCFDDIVYIQQQF